MNLHSEQKGKVYIVEFESSLGTFCKVGKSVEPEERIKTIIGNFKKVPTVKYVKAIASNVVDDYSKEEITIHTCLDKYRNTELNNMVSFVGGGSECFLGSMQTLMKCSKTLGLMWYYVKFDSESTQRAFRLKKKITNDGEIDEIVKYRNEFNKLNLTNLNSCELNLFMSIVSCLRDRGNKEISLAREDLKELARFKHRNSSRFKKAIEAVKHNTFDNPLEYVGGDETQQYVHLFSEFNISPDYSCLTIKVSKEGQMFFNDLTGNFTRFSLYQFTQLKSRYSKILFMLVKQFRTLGIRRVRKDDFLKILGVPKTYKSSNIDQKVFEPSIKELSSMFNKIKINKIKHHNIITGYRIIFSKESHFKDDFGYFRKDDSEWKYFK